MTGKNLDCTLADTVGIRLSTRSGIALVLRPVTIHDGPLIAELYENLGPDGLRFRFLVGMSHITLEHLTRLSEVDHRHSEHVLAFAADDPKHPIASLLIAADQDMECADVAIAIARSWRDKGIGHALLAHAVELARERGLRVLRSVESCANHDAIEVERTLGFIARAYEGDTTLLVLEKALV